MVTLAGSGLSNDSPQTIPAGSLNLSGVLWKRSTFFAPWRSSASNSVPNPPAFSALVRAEIVFDTGGSGQCWCRGRLW